MLYTSGQKSFIAAGGEYPVPATKNESFIMLPHSSSEPDKQPLMKIEAHAL